MGLTMKQRKAITQELAARYQHARKAERGRMLGEFVQLTHYHRTYASHLLANWNRRKTVLLNGKRTIVVFGRVRTALEHRGRRRTYDHRVLVGLRRLWAISNGLCGKRLVPAIREMLPVLERCEEITLAQPTRLKLLAISPATVDRLLAADYRKSPFHGRSRTKPGTLLKHHIPIRTFAEWNEQRPGFLEIDLVSHDGGLVRSDALQSLDVTDVATGWTETVAVQNKAQRWVFEALQQIFARLPFPVQGIDSDNGSEFINNHLRRFCELHQITFTRSRPYRKNDSCYVEQKNFSVVRKTVGYWLYNTPYEQRLLNRIYAQLRLFSNFFQPVMKLKTKTRSGSKVHKSYDTPTTPYRRILADPTVSKSDKKNLVKIYETLNPAALRRSIDKLTEQLSTFAERKYRYEKRKPQHRFV